MKDKILKAIPYDMDAGKRHCTFRWLRRKLNSCRHKEEFRKALLELEREGRIRIRPDSYYHQGASSEVIELMTE